MTPLGTDPIVQHLKQFQKPVTMENYVKYGFDGKWPSAEQQELIPQAILDLKPGEVLKMK